MDNLFTFLSLLTTGMHNALPWSKVIWYDSVTVDGNLKWQNALNKMNQPFFELCDGIFLNYLWKVPLLYATATFAGHRRGDVYVGIDVFGRKCYGDGGYNTNKALAVIKQASLSAAVFAPGWVYETQPKTQFFHNQDKFWLLLEPYCPVGEPHALPMVSSFSRGCGEMMFVDGVLVHLGHWSNLSAQDLQPSFFSTMLRNDVKVYLQVWGSSGELLC
ncbi:Cytosolic endo-beta-N-acetylglucosaminidase [Geodia barretti]|uniref:Cytosolic endo-beta-N-acetylglucosaminidase n=2 Tax=Geodia barretti TaxID=519541 RepID=A0AA35TNM1_GEOBA|nr:Cytosolic endo-beta-N-acetylglucosaminidase [Geodia barretti]